MIITYLAFILILIVIVIVETYSIGKSYIYKIPDTKHKQINKILYNLLQTNKEKYKAYRVSDTFYTLSTNGNSMLFFKMKLNSEINNDGVYLITDKIHSPKICMFINNGYKFICDSDGLWIDTKYKRPTTESDINCVQYILSSMSPSSDVQSVHCSLYIDNTDNGFTILLKDKTNNINLVYLYPYIKNKRITEKISCDDPMTCNSLDDRILFVGNVDDTSILKVIDTK